MLPLKFTTPGQLTGRFYYLEVSLIGFPPPTALNVISLAGLCVCCFHLKNNPAYVSVM